MTRREIKAGLKSFISNMELVEAAYGEDAKRSIYIGSALSLDPCGKYHHVFSPNGVTSNCIRYWENLEKAAEELGGWLETGDGDPLDNFFCLPLGNTPPS